MFAFPPPLSAFPGPFVCTVSRPLSFPFPSSAYIGKKALYLLEPKDKCLLPVARDMLISEESTATQLLPGGQCRSVTLYLHIRVCYSTRFQVLPCSSMFFHGLLSSLLRIVCLLVSGLFYSRLSFASCACLVCFFILSLSFLLCAFSSVCIICLDSSLSCVISLSFLSMSVLRRSSVARVPKGR